VPQPPKRGLSTGWIVAIVAASLLVVAGVGVGAFALLNSSGSSYDKPNGKYGAAPLPSCEEVADRVGDLPRNSSDTKLQGSKGWLCAFTNSADGLTVNLDLEVNNVRQERDKFDIATSSGASVLDPTVQLGEKAAWGLAPDGQMCELSVLDSNATLKVGVDDRGAARGDTQTCKNRAKAIAQTFYDSIQPR
jgi:hypothetical protein